MEIRLTQDPKDSSTAPLQNVPSQNTVTFCKRLTTTVAPYSMTHRQLDAIKTLGISSFFKRDFKGHTS